MIRSVRLAALVLAGLAAPAVAHGGVLPAEIGMEVMPPRLVEPPGPPEAGIVMPPGQSGGGVGMEIVPIPPPNPLPPPSGGPTYPPNPLPPAWGGPTYPPYTGEWPRHFHRPPLRDSSFSGCTTGDAVEAAQLRYRLKQVRVDYKDDVVIAVIGKRQGRWRGVVFSRRAGCPEIAR